MPPKYLKPQPKINIDPQIMGHLHEHIEKQLTGVLMTEDARKGKAFPMIDPITIAQLFKTQHKVKYNRINIKSLEEQINYSYEALKMNSPINGGAGLEDMKAISKNVKEQINTMSPPITQVAKKSKDFLSTPKSSAIVSMTALNKNNKSPFDDDDDDDGNNEENSAVDNTKEKNIVSSNNSMRNLYKTNPPTVEKKTKEKKRKYEEVDTTQLPEYLQKKLAFKRLHQQGLSVDEAENAVKKMTFKQAGKSVSSSVPQVTFNDVGGIEAILDDIGKLVQKPIEYYKFYQQMKVDPPTGILLHGPSGCGKTLLANAIAGELQIPILKATAADIVSGVSGDSESKLRQLFQDAQTQAPCILFIDDIDSLAPKRDDSQKMMEKRIVTVLTNCLDALRNRQDKPDEVQDNSVNEDGEARTVAEFAMDENENTLDMGVNQTVASGANKTVIVIAATSRIGSIDPSLRVSGRFDKEISMGLPDDKARKQILSVMCRKLYTHPDIDYDYLARKTIGYVGADIASLTRQVGIIALDRIVKNLEKYGLEGFDQDLIKSFIIKNPTPSMSDTDEEASEKDVTLYNIKELHDNATEEQLQKLYITQEDFIEAMKSIQPTAKREGFATVPQITWNDVGALELLQEELDMAIVEPILDPDLFKSMGLNVPAGVLFFGPPGCGKTLVAQAVANQSGASFLSVKGPELLSQYVGESEANVRRVFERARTCSPCIIFFDEIDALVPIRGTGGNQASERVVNMLLTELDGVGERRNVFVIAATNRPDIIDPAMLRPGRLDKLLYISLPDALGRLSILKKQVLGKIPVDDDVDLELIANDPRADGYSGADLYALVREATVASLKQLLQDRRTLFAGLDSKSLEFAEAKKRAGSMKAVVNAKHFTDAFMKVRASVSKETRAKYDQMNRKMAQGRFTVTEAAEIKDGSCSSGASASK